MKKKYISPKIEVIVLDIEESITASSISRITPVSDGAEMVQDVWMIDPDDKKDVIQWQ